MIKTILLLVICTTGLLRIKAQQSVVDSVRLLIEEIVETSYNNISACKKFNDYKTRIIQLDLSDPNDALSKFIASDSIFRKANINNNCPLVKMVTRLDSQLHVLKNTGITDTTGLLNAFLYAKNKYSGFVIMKLELMSKETKIQHPEIALHSLDPYVLPVPGRSDSTQIEIYLLPAKKYIMTIASPGYNSINKHLILEKDTFLAIHLNEIIIEPEAPKPDIEPKRSYWWIVSILLALGLAVLSLKILTDKKKNTSYEYPTTPQKSDGNENKKEFLKPETNEQKKEKEILSGKDKRELEKLETHGLKESNPKIENIPTVKQDIKPRYFLSEIMMTAGPRKKLNVDKDLGEDVCGFMIAGDEVFVWLLDGASDYFDPLVNPETKREYFSSRLLAQSIARKLRSHFAERKMEDFEKTMLTVTTDVKTDWLSAINSLPETEKRILKNNLKDGIQPDCASTVLIGYLSLNGELNVYRSGDSKMLVYGTSSGQKVYIDTSLSSKNDKIGPVSFLLTLTQTDEFDIIIRQSKSEIVRQEKIQAIIGFSDGIGKTTEKEFIKEYPVNTEAVRSEIIYQLQGTGDDKALCIIEIKE